MKIGNRGFADWMLLVMLCASVLLTGCALLPGFWKTPSGPKGLPTDHFAQDEVILSEPVVTTVTAPYSGEKVDVNIGQRVSKTYSKVVDRTPPKVSLWGKLWAIGGIWTIIIGAVVIFVPGAMSVFLLLLGQAKNSLTQAFTQTSRGIERYLQQEQDSESKKKLLAALSAEMSPETKVMVTKVKQAEPPV